MYDASKKSNCIHLSYDVRIPEGCGAEWKWSYRTGIRIGITLSSCCNDVNGEVYLPILEWNELPLIAMYHSYHGQLMTALLSLSLVKLKVNDSINYSIVHLHLGILEH